jgi:hypothetical protein
MPPRDVSVAVVTVSWSTALGASPPAQVRDSALPCGACSVTHTSWCSLIIAREVALTGGAVQCGDAYLTSPTSCRHKVLKALRRELGAAARHPLARGPALQTRQQTDSLRVCDGGGCPPPRKGQIGKPQRFRDQFSLSWLNVLQQLTGRGLCQVRRPRAQAHVRRGRQNQGKPRLPAACAASTKHSPGRHTSPCSATLSDRGISPLRVRDGGGGPSARDRPASHKRRF